MSTEARVRIPAEATFFSRFLMFLYKFFFNARSILSIIPSTTGKIAGETV